MAYVPTYVLWNSTKTAIVYTFSSVFDDTSIANDPGNYIEKQSLRGIGSIIIPGSSVAPFDLSISFRLRGANYETLIALIDGLGSTIVKNTPYVLKIGRTALTTKDYNVKRILPFQRTDNTNVVRWVDITCTFRANSWA